MKYISLVKLRLVLFSSLKHTRRKLNHAKNFILAVRVHVPGTRYHVAIGEELECQRERGNVADTHALERELPLVTYLERFYLSVSVLGYNCLRSSRVLRSHA